MAQRVEILLEDDFDGGSADETVAFGLDGAAYEIDLSEANAAKLRDQIAPWMTAARKTGGRRARRTSTSPDGRRSRASSGPSSPKQLAAVRAWARDNGYQVSDRGRVPARVRDAYKQAHNQ
jgi:hypothetical protein